MLDLCYGARGLQHFKTHHCQGSLQCLSILTSSCWWPQASSWWHLQPGGISHLSQRMVVVSPGAPFMMRLSFSKGNQVQRGTGHCPDLLL